MSKPYILFANSTNMTQSNVQLITTKNSISTNGREHMLQENTMIWYSTNSTVLTALDNKVHTAEQKFISNR